MISVVLAVSLMLTKCRVAESKKYYAVYYDPADYDGFNPKGYGYEPVGPDEWNKVNYFGDFFDWSAEGVYLGKSSEECVNLSPRSREDPNTSQYSNTHSPLRITSDSPWWNCNDRHDSHEWPGSGCEYDFKTTPYGLRAELSYCTDAVPSMDISRTSTPWEMVYMEIKVPAEHLVPSESGSGYKRYDGELVLAHRGTGLHEGEIAYLSILLEGDKKSRNHTELQKYLKEWKKYLSAKYTDCRVSFDEDTCELRKSRKHEKHRNLLTFKESDDDTFDGDAAHLHYAPSNQTTTERYLRRHGDRIRPYSIIRKLSKEGYYYGYDGSLTHPPCNGDVSWRIIRKPLKIAQKQMDLINKLIAGHINEDCELGTFGKWQNSDSCFVDVTRPVQYTTKEHHLVNCDQWVVEP